MEVNIVISGTFLQVIGWTFVVWALVNSINVAMSIYNKIKSLRAGQNIIALGDYFNGIRGEEE